MAVKPSVNYPANTAAPDANYPYGSAQNVTAPGDGTGTPLEQAWVNDVFGYFQKLLNAAGVVPSGAPETILASDYFDSLEKLFSRFTIFVDTGTANAKALAAVSGADVAAYSSGLRAGFFVNTTNSGAATAKIAALAAASIRLGGVALSGGELKAGTFAELVYNTGSGWWDLAQAAPASGSQVGFTPFQTGAYNTGAIEMPADDSIPQSNEGNLFMTAPAHTPKKATNILKIEVVAQLGFSVAGTATLSAALFKDAVAGAVAAGTGAKALLGNARTAVGFTHYMVAGSTAPVVFKVRCGALVAGTTYFNGANTGRVYGGVSASSIMVTEIEA